MVVPTSSAPPSTIRLIRGAVEVAGSQLSFHNGLPMLQVCPSMSNLRSLAL